MAKGKWDRWLTDDGLLLLQGWARDGLTDVQIAQKMGIGVSTLSKWKVRFVEIGEALKDGKEAVDMLVENALLKRALGFEYDEITTERVRIRGGYEDDNDPPEFEMVETKRVRKMVIPDTTAQIYWLKNRKRDVWKDNHDRSEVDWQRLEVERKLADAQIAKLQREADADVVSDMVVGFDSDIGDKGWAE